MKFNINKITSARVFISLIIISLAFENFKLFDIMGAAFKPIQAVAVLSILYYAVFKGVTFKSVIGALVFLLIPLAPIYRISDTREFFKTYAIYAIIVLFVAVALPHLKQGFKEDAEMYYRLFNNVIIILCILGIIQFILMNAAGIMFLDGVFGKFQFHFSATTVQSGFYRAYSLFHEPSYFGWVLDIALAINLVIKSDREAKRKPFIIVMLVATIIMTVSSSAIWIMIMILLVYLLTIRRLSAKALIITPIAIGALILVVSMIDFSFVEDSLGRLFYESQKEGSSAYERLQTPMEYISATMENFPLFGRGMGQEGDADKIGIIGTYQSVHNSVLGIIVIFGLSSIIYYLWLISQFFNRKYGHKRIMQRVVLFLAVVGMYFATGAFLSFDTFIFTIILMLFMTMYETEDSLNDEYEQVEQSDGLLEASEA